MVFHSFPLSKFEISSFSSTTQFFLLPVTYNVQRFRHTANARDAITWWPWPWRGSVSSWGYPESSIHFDGSFHDINIYINCPAIGYPWISPWRAGNPLISSHQPYMKNQHRHIAILYWDPLACSILANTNKVWLVVGLPL